MTLTSTEMTLQRDGRSIAYWLAGPEGRPLVTLTHGAGLGHRMFDAQVAALVSAYRVLTWDLAGYDRSQPMGRNFSIRSCADDLLALVEAAGYQQAVVVGESLGSYIAQEYVYRTPERALALVSIGATGITQVHARPDRFALRLLPRLIRWLPYRFVRFATGLGAGVTREAQQYAYHALTRIRQRDFARMMNAIPHGLHPDPTYQVPVPTLLTHGERDTFIRIPAYAPGWAATIPTVRVVGLPDAGHNANMDNPDAFNRALLDFLHAYVP